MTRLPGSSAARFYALEERALFGSSTEHIVRLYDEPDASQRHLSSSSKRMRLLIPLCPGHLDGGCFAAQSCRARSAAPLPLVHAGMLA